MIQNLDPLRKAEKLGVKLIPFSCPADARHANLPQVKLELSKAIGERNDVILATCGTFCGKFSLTSVVSDFFGLGFCFFRIARLGGL